MADRDGFSSIDIDRKDSLIDPVSEPLSPNKTSPTIHQARKMQISQPQRRGSLIEMRPTLSQESNQSSNNSLKGKEREQNFDLSEPPSPAKIASTEKRTDSNSSTTRPATTKQISPKQVTFGHRARSSGSGSASGSGSTSSAGSTPRSSRFAEQGLLEKQPVVPKNTQPQNPFDDHTHAMPDKLSIISIDDDGRVESPHEFNNDEKDSDKAILNEYHRRESKSHFSAPLSKWEMTDEENNASKDLEDGFKYDDQPISQTARSGRRWFGFMPYVKLSDLNNSGKANGQRAGSAIRNAWARRWVKLIIALLLIFILVMIILAIVCVASFRALDVSCLSAGNTIVWQTDLLGFSSTRTLDIGVGNAAGALDVTIEKLNLVGFYQDMQFGTGSTTTEFIRKAHAEQLPVTAQMLFEYNARTSSDGAHITSMNAACQATKSLEMSFDVSGTFRLLNFMSLNRDLGRFYTSMACDDGMTTAIHESAYLFNLTKQYQS